MALSWNQVGTLKGPQGDRGETGPQGPAGPGITFGDGAPSASSQPGAVYVDVADGFKVYQYRDNG